MLLAYPIMCPDGNPIIRSRGLQMSQRIISQRQRVTGAMLTLAVVVISMFTLSLPAANAAGSSARVANSSSSSCSVEVRRAWGSGYLSEIVNPGRTSVYPGYAAAITSSCTARWSGTSTWVNGPAVMAVSQTTTKTILAIKK